MNRYFTVRQVVQISYLMSRSDAQDIPLLNCHRALWRMLLYSCISSFVPFITLDSFGSNATSMYHAEFFLSRLLKIKVTCFYSLWSWCDPSEYLKSWHTEVLTASAHRSRIRGRMLQHPGDLTDYGDFGFPNTDP